RAGIDEVTYALRTAAPDAPAGTPARTGVVSLQLVRQGPNSIYGDVEIRTLKNGKPDQILGGLRGLEVYPEVDRRAGEGSLARPWASGELAMVIFRDEDAKPGVYRASAGYTAP